MWLAVVLICAVTYRVSRFIVDDKLAQPVVSRVQEWAEKRWLAKNPDANQEADEYQSMLGYLGSCIWCVSIYVGGITTAIVDLWFVHLAMPVMVALAASGVAGLASTYEHSKDD